MNAFVIVSSPGKGTRTHEWTSTVASSPGDLAFFYWGPPYQEITAIGLVREKPKVKAGDWFCDFWVRTLATPLGFREGGTGTVLQTWYEQEPLHQHKQPLEPPIVAELVRQIIKANQHLRPWLQKWWLMWATAKGIDKTVGSENDEDRTSTNQLRSAEECIDGEGYFESRSADDERERKLREIVQRRGQPDFRVRLIEAYGGRCAVTGCDAVPALEASHVTPYLGPESNHVSNGLLLRADIHTLFDLDLIGIDPSSLRIAVSEQLLGTCYEEMEGNLLSVSSDSSLHPNKAALQQRWERFQSY